MGYLVSGQGKPDESDVVLFGPARPRRRRPWLLRGALVAIVAAAGIGIAIGSSSHQPAKGGKQAKSAQPPQVTVTNTGHRILGVTASWELFARGAQSLVGIEPATGVITRTIVPPLESNNPEVTLVVGTDEVVVRSFDDVPGYMVHDGDPASPLPGSLAVDGLGPLLPGPDPSQAWQLESSPGLSLLSLVGLDGRPTGTTIRLPATGALPATAVADGRGYVLLLTSGNRLYDAGPTWYREIRAQVLAVGPVRWLGLSCRGQHCRNVVVNAATGSKRTLPGPALRDSAFSWPPLGVTSPDGSTAAVPVFASTTSGGSVTLLLVNLRSGASKRVDVPMSPSPGYQIMAFSPDGHWLFVAAAAGRLQVVDAGTGKVASLGGIKLPAIYQIAMRDAPG